MATVKPGLGGRGVAVQIESKPHPPSHFEGKEMRVTKNDDGTFGIRKEHGLKKRFQNKEEFHHGYMPDTTASAANVEEVAQHMHAHFGGKKKASGSANSPRAAAAAEPDGDEDDAY